MRKTTARRPDLTLEDAEECIIWNIAEKRREKLQKYQQLAFEIRERRVGFMVEIVPLVIGCLGGGMEKLEEHKEADKREISSAMGSKRNAKDRITPFAIHYQKI